MPSEIAQGIVDHIFGDEKAKAVDAFNDAMAATAYDAIQAQKKEFAQKMGFELDQTAQSAADELEDKLVDDGSGETKVEPVLPDRLPHEPPVDATPASVEEPIEEPKNETDS
jgi:hypothetical protein|tara:strand:- start:2113 stop:2448 length:336 start_codon:yes stop_codon:yes gene_type:complete